MCEGGVKHILGFSGGVDSQMVALLLRQLYGDADVILLCSNAGRNEYPITDEYVSWYSENIHHVFPVSAEVADLWETPGFAESKGLIGEEELTFDKLVNIKGYPTRKNRICTYFLKIVPQKKWMLRHCLTPGGMFYGEDYERYTGLRRDESPKRASTPDREWDSYFDCWLNHPIAALTKKECFDYVIRHGEPINPLYREGFKRVGCKLCIEAGKDEILQTAIRHPEVIAEIEERENRTGKTHFQHVVPGSLRNSIDEVVKWAQTDRGGRQSNMFKILNERPSCESKYGLCE